MLSKMTPTDRHYINIHCLVYLQDKTNLRERRNWLRDSMGFLANKAEEVPADVDNMVRSCPNTRGNSRKFILGGQRLLPILPETTFASSLSKSP